MKKLLSYVWPLTRTIDSTINGPLELTWINGKKVLDSKNANYSYGTLQKLLTYGLSKIEIPPTATILLLGLGGGSIINPLRKRFQHKGKITAIEIDPVVIEIAKEEFFIDESKNLQIVCQDASHFVYKCVHHYDIIIVDLFIDNKVPEEYYSVIFWRNLLRLLNKNGKVVFNAGIHVKNYKQIDQLIQTLSDTITFEQYHDVEGANTLLIGSYI
ncbi:spermidine synthase [Aquimarina hainanensis]|uniref:Spermidine synthase n=1 Tax=Aquimarina hainanensis TaxID=1578017 RepID=A0ABW5ND72_9FLAO|nr:fused MFS/spermidine synthase [Aquimarina sp. TRL1]QKX07345.1 fused MFS/spermidine synthase [Aquimarina sp. TRL1]